ncbi:hypothetical protein V6N12_069506 [Hibiscus sabdariffa]|uniref:Uncharacterized protein n=1 Tax=Hibiscus sabdariffa TaxID=183260 RepID=A0ABR2FE21_9ROSI
MVITLNSACMSHALIANDTTSMLSWLEVGASTLPILNSQGLRCDYVVATMTSSIPTTTTESDLANPHCSPRAGTIKINTDRALNMTTKDVAIGFIACDDKGTVLGGLAQ